MAPNKLRNAEWVYDPTTGVVSDLGGRPVAYVSASRMDLSDIETGDGLASQIGRLMASAPALRSALIEAREKMLGSSPAMTALREKTDAALAQSAASL